VLAFAPGDLRRAFETFRKVTRASLWLVELLSKGGRSPFVRPLNDLDFITDSFAHDFLFRHVHPLDPPFKMLVQMVDADQSLRVDVFRARTATIDRAREMDLPPVGRVRVISIMDLAAGMARLVFDLACEVAVPSKYARDFLRAMELVEDPAVVRSCVARSPEARASGFVRRSVSHSAN